MFHSNRDVQSKSIQNLKKETIIAYNGKNSSLLQSLANVRLLDGIFTVLDVDLITDSLGLCPAPPCPPKAILQSFSKMLLVITTGHIITWIRHCLLYILDMSFDIAES